MYILACLLMVKVYQIRHPDIVTSAHKVYVLFAGIILIAVIGVVSYTYVLYSLFCISKDEKTVFGVLASKAERKFGLCFAPNRLVVCLLFDHVAHHTHNNHLTHTAFHSLRNA